MTVVFVLDPATFSLRISTGGRVFVIGLQKGVAAARGRSNQSAWEFPARLFLEIREYTEEPLGTAWRSEPPHSILSKLL
jgi:hypothetical protein